MFQVRRHPWSWKKEQPVRVTVPGSLLKGQGNLVEKGRSGKVVERERRSPLPIGLAGS